MWKYSRKLLICLYSLFLWPIALLHVFKHSKRDIVFVRRANDSVILRMKRFQTRIIKLRAVYMTVLSEDYSTPVAEINAISPGCCFMMWILYLKNNRTITAFRWKNAFCDLVGESSCACSVVAPCLNSPGCKVVNLNNMNKYKLVLLKLIIVALPPNVTYCICKCCTIFTKLIVSLAVWWDALMFLYSIN